MTSSVFWIASLEATRSLPTLLSCLFHPHFPPTTRQPIIPLPSIFNFNFLNYFDLAPMMTQTLNTGRATLSYLQTNQTGSDTEDLIRTFMTLNQYRHDEIDYIANSDPLTQVAYPVFDGYNPMTKNVTGMVITTIFWRLLFANVLPESVQGVMCVLTNSLGDQATYRIDGRLATFLGPGDLHDTQYDDMVQSRDVADYIAERADPRLNSYTTVELDVGYTSYQIFIYPSQDFEDTYITNEPIVYAVIVAIIFIFTSAVFLLYDYFVESRQRKVMDKAVKSTAVVTSLFPEAVHERLFANGDKSSNEFSQEMNAWKAASMNNGGDGEGSNALHELMELRASQNQGPSLEQLNNHNNNHGKKKKKNRPIADKFANVTILFADLAGKTGVLQKYMITCRYALVSLC